MELSAGNVKAAMKDAGAVSADLWQVDPVSLRVLEGFNVRVKGEAYDARVRAIADSIKVNGFYRDKPLSGYVAREDDVNVIYITGGHRRHEAVLLAISEGAAIPAVPVIVSPKGTSMEDLTVALVVGNDGEPLSLYEAATVCKRLSLFGWSTADIARRLGYASAQYVDGLLLLAAAPVAMRNAVIAGEVSATTAIQLLRTHGAKAVDMLKTAKAVAGKAKVTAKFMPDAVFKKQVRKAAEPMYNLLEQLAGSEAYAGIPNELRDLIDNLLAEVKK